MIPAADLGSIRFSSISVLCFSPSNSAVRLLTINSRFSACFSSFFSTLSTMSSFLQSSQTQELIFESLVFGSAPTEERESQTRMHITFSSLLRSALLPASYEKNLRWASNAAFNRFEEVYKAAASKKIRRTCGEIHSYGQQKEKVW